MPFSTSSAVLIPWRESPSSTRVMATDGCIPTTTVSASKRRAIPAILPSIRPMKESTISRLEMSINTPEDLESRLAGLTLGDAGAAFVLSAAPDESEADSEPLAR